MWTKLAYKLDEKINKLKYKFISTFKIQKKLKIYLTWLQATRFFANKRGDTLAYSWGTRIFA